MSGGTFTGFGQVPFPRTGIPICMSVKFCWVTYQKKIARIFRAEQVNIANLYCLVDSGEVLCELGNGMNNLQCSFCTFWCLYTALQVNDHTTAKLRLLHTFYQILYARRAHCRSFLARFIEQAFHRKVKIHSFKRSPNFISCLSGSAGKASLYMIVNVIQRLRGHIRRNRHTLELINTVVFSLLLNDIFVSTSRISCHNKLIGNDKSGAFKMNM